MRTNSFTINRFVALLGWMAFTGWLFAGCQPAAFPSSAPTVPAVSSRSETPSPAAAWTASPSPLPTRTLTLFPTQTPVFQPVGPTAFPSGINPLTGLQVTDPAVLELPPALVSISNSPQSARPQSGLSFSSMVFEMYIGEGASRFLAVFYGDYPPEALTEGSEPVRIGPIRSGRLPYEKLRLLYKGFLVFASASDRVLQFLDEYYIIHGDTKAEDVNTARVTVHDLKQLAKDFQGELGTPRLFGLRFDSMPPPGGTEGRRLWIPFHHTNQVFWHYDPAQGAYLRSQDQSDGMTFIPSLDQLTDRPLAFENIAVIFADYHYYDAAYFNIDLLYITRAPALLFRDGKMYEIFWSTGNETYERSTGRFRPIRFVDREGNPIPLHPGKTWVEIVPQHTAYGETVDSEVYRDLITKKQPGSGNWAVYFYPPPLEGTMTPVPTAESE
ncbi:MAG: DUF3048 C-terminal domain-containing protein [Anaerolineaceae bacterium]|nr:DUF3048 C-terminal domain-containing protein [Anaerolineaceae bacterium]